MASEVLSVEKSKSPTKGLCRSCAGSQPSIHAVRSQARKVVGKEIVDLEHDLRPVRCLDLFHDVANMHLDGAFAQIEFIGDDFVRLSAPERLYDFGLTIREYVCQPT